MNLDQAGISSAELRRIVARASSMFERLDPQTFSPSPDADEQLLRSRLDAWRQAVAKGDSEQFQRCLAWDGLSTEMARRAVTPVSLRHDAPLPAWATTLSEVLRLASATVPPAPDGQSAAPHRFLDRRKPLPFEELLIPFILYAQRDLRRRAGACYHRLTDQAHAVLERALLGELIDTAAQPLLLAFDAWKAGRQSSMTRLLARIQDPRGCSLYLGFIHEMLSGQQIPFFIEYAALARLLATMTDLWVGAQHEFLQRLNADWPMIDQTFGGGALGRVTDIQTLLSDPHRGRRSVMALRIEPGVAVVYKPKNLGNERAYNHLLTWLNEQGCPLPLKVLQVIDQGSYGWVECVEPLPCDDMAALARHYRRAGMLLCLVYALEGVDCHYENLIAHGEHPVLIDTETLMHHRPDSETAGPTQTAQHRAAFQMNNSVMRTALLALWHVDSNLGAAFDFSGLGSHVQEERLYKGLQWSLVNTDHMSLDLKELRIPAPSHHVPTVRGESARLADWVATVAAGFAQMYRFLLEQRDALLAAESPLWNMAGQPTRYLFRPTDVYLRLMWQLREPEYLRDGVERSLGLEVLKRAAAGVSERPTFWPIVQAECPPLEQLDVPYFVLSSDDDVLELSPGNRVTGYLQGSGFQSVLERIKTLSEADLAMQVQLIQGSLYLRTVPGQESAAAEQPGARATGKVRVEREEREEREERAVLLDDAALAAEALAIAGRLRERAIRAPDGSATWLAPQLNFQHERFQFQPMGASLYDGRLGIALFLAAVERVRGDGECRDLCLGALREYRRALPGSEQARAERSYTQSVGLGLAGELGGAMYALTRVGTLLGDDSLVADALGVARLLTPEVIANDSQLDIIGGTAGALLGLLALYRVVQDPDVLESAVACGGHLLAQSVINAHGRAWKTLNGRLLTGFSHGAAGIAYALLKLAEVTEDAEFKAAAAEGIAYEQSTFLPDVGNWPDLRDFSRYPDATGKSGPRSLMSSWCHGATGIGLGRLGGLTILESAAIHQDIQVALQTTRNYLAHRQDMVDQLCCGNMGRIDFLLCAAQRLGQPELLAEAKVHASRVVQEARKRGYALEPALHSSVYVPGFFRGETGVGYTLLRLTDAEKLPAILLGE